MPGIPASGGGLEIMNSTPRIVITGAGAVCGSGLDVASIWAAIQDGHSSVAAIRQWRIEPARDDNGQAVRARTAIFVHLQPRT